MTFLLSQGYSGLPQKVFGVWLQSFLFTGLFIVAHDCMHSLVVPHNLRLNRWVGKLCCFLYAGFSYEKLLVNHLKHHKNPATSLDPDYTDAEHEGFVMWLSSFIRRYFGWKEFLVLHIHVGLVWYLGGEWWMVFVYFAIPSWVSSLQLFYFGTYLPHRGFQDAKKNELPSRSNDFPVWLSLLTCYHFGYHREHHLYPNLTWWQLPQERQKTKMALEGKDA
ncbi:MAG: fatty acid desaturase [Bdellovibrionales bacterium]